MTSKYKFKNILSAIFKDNWNFKMVALLVSLMLWFGILNRRDYVLIQRVDLDVKVAAQTKIIAQTADFIKLRVSGPRTELKKFMERTQELSIDISDRGIGLIDVDIPIYKIETPPGVKILGVKPNLIRVEVAPN